MTFLGCATVPPAGGLAVYSLDGKDYFSLSAFCDMRGLRWSYDTVTRTMTLSNDGHTVKMMSGERLVSVDDRISSLDRPAKLHLGMLMAPVAFKSDVLDNLFKEKVNQVCPLVLPNSRIKKIVIDAGHGGHDPGATGRSDIKEKVVNLDIALRLSKILRSCGFDVVMSRADDTFVPLAERANIANTIGADLFLSIHSNANRARSMEGFEVYYISVDTNDAERALNAAESGHLAFEAASFAEDSPDIRATLWDMILASDRAESIDIAQKICSSASSCLKVKILGIKGARFQVLRQARMPALLVEVGFLSNSAEEGLLKTGEYRQRVAQAIAEGLKNYVQN